MLAGGCGEPGPRIHATVLPKNSAYPQIIIAVTSVHAIHCNERLFNCFLSAPLVRLTGTKLGCGEGGCGACTVMLSWYQGGVVTHAAVNACLAPLCSVDGMAVTTVEGIGSSRSLLHPVQVFVHNTNSAHLFPTISQFLTLFKVFFSVLIIRTLLLLTTLIHNMFPLSPQERIARAHGSQCGFCTPGFVMSMYTLLRNCHAPSYKEIEGAFEGACAMTPLHVIHSECVCVFPSGNLCRCTGYRPILEGFKTFSQVPPNNDPPHTMPPTDCLHTHNAPHNSPPTLLV